MRLIDADDLKKAIEDGVTFIDGDSLYKIIGIIDNTQTVKPCENCDLYLKAMTKEEMQKGD